MFIPIIIDDKEILVRFIFQDNFKKKKIELDNLIDKDIFLDSRLSGVSLQRENYTTEEKCKDYAKQIISKIYTGFVLFLKKDFDEIVLEYQQERQNFEAELVYSPLDETENYLAFREKSCVNQEGKPAHADILYINPAIKNEEPTPNTSLRQFSKKLMKRCKVIIEDENNIITNGDFHDCIHNS